MEDKFTYQAFEVEDIHARENYTYVYNPYEQSVEMYDTSRNVIGGKKLVGRKVKEFNEQCETAYDYYKYLHAQSHTIDPERPVVILGYVHPETIYPIAEMEEWDESKRIKRYKRVVEELSKVHTILTNSIKDNKIRELIREHTYLAGGSIASLINGVKANDYDFFFNDKEAMNKVIQWFVDRHNIKYAGTNKKYKINTFINDKGKIQLSTSREFVMSDEQDNKEMEPCIFSSRAISFPGRIQLIIDSDDEESKCYQRFDFVHSMGNYHPQTDKLNVPEYVLKLIEYKKLIYNVQGTNPVGSARRLLKFAERGWFIDRHEHNKLLRNIAKLNTESSELWDEEYVF